MEGQLDNYLLLANTAKQGGNNEEALLYYNKILEVDPTVEEAWAGKAIAILYSSKIADVKSPEAISYLKNAVTVLSSSDFIDSVVIQVMSFCSSSFVTISNHYTKFRSTRFAVEDYTNRFLRLISLLDYAEQISKNPKLIYETGATITTNFLRIASQTNKTALITQKFTYYTGKLKAINPSYKVPVPQNGCALLILFIVSILLTSTAFVSCNRGNNPPSSQYVGNWKGSYVTTSTLKDSGTATLVVMSDGSATGTSTSITYSQTFQMSGMVTNSGQLTLTYGNVNSGATFTGVLTGSNGSGTWTNRVDATRSYAGIWNAAKQ